MRGLALGGLLLTVAGCGPLVQVGGTGPRPVAVHTLTAVQPPSSPVQGPVDLTRAVTVDAPTVPGALQTLRIPVMVDDISIQYVREAQWSEPPARLFQRLLADTLMGRGVAVVDQRSSGQLGGQRLTGQLMLFGVDARGPAPVVRIRYDAMLAGPGGVRQRRFDADAPIAGVDGGLAAAALNGAANALAREVADWVRASAGPG